MYSHRIRVLLAHLLPAPEPPPRPAVRATATAAAEEGAEPASLPDDFVHPTMKYRPRPWTKAQLDALRAADPPEHLIAIRGRVYDVTHFLDDHPGGGDVITELDDYADEEMTDAYDEAEHSEEANADLKQETRKEGRGRARRREEGKRKKGGPKKQREAGEGWRDGSETSANAKGSERETPMAEAMVEQRSGQSPDWVTQACTSNTHTRAGTHTHTHTHHTVEVDRKVRPFIVLPPIQVSAFLNFL